MVTSVQQTLLTAGAALLLSLNPQDAELVKDLNDEPSSFPSGFVRAAMPAGDQLYFAATLPRGDGLWRTDGTEEGTVFLRGMTATFDIGSPELWSAVTEEGELIYRHPDTGWLSRTDGTVQGTGLLVGDIAAEERPRSSSNFARLASGRWVFSAFSQAQGQELWATDGTAAGTEILDFVRPGEDSGVASRHLEELDGRALFFSSPDPLGGPVEERQHSLWISDGTAAGTFELADLGQGSPRLVRVRPTAEGSSPNAVLFQVFRTGAVDEVWITDGTAEGTRRLDSLPAGSLGAQVEGTAALGEDLLFILRTRGEPAGSGPCLLFRSAGLTVTEVLDFRDVSAFPPNSGFEPCPFGPVAAGGRVYFSFDDGIHGLEPWVSDGTEAGTHLIADLNPGVAGSFSSSIVPWRGGVAFSAFHGHDVGTRIVASDGTVAGTRQISDRTGVEVLSSWGERLVFTTATSLGAVELWQIEGTPEAEQRIAVLDTAVASSDPRLYLRLGDRTLLGARTGGAEESSARRTVRRRAPWSKTSPPASPRAP